MADWLYIRIADELNKTFAIEFKVKLVVLKVYISNEINKINKSNRFNKYKKIALL